MSQSNHGINRQYKKHLNTPSVDNKSCAPFLMGELQSAIKKMKGKGAAGPDNIPPSFLKWLGQLALQELLSIFNSFSLAHCPPIWRIATTIPYAKLGNLVKSSLTFPSVSRHVWSNFWNVFLPTVCTILWKPTISLVNFKPVLGKDRAVKIKLLK